MDRNIETYYKSYQKNSDSILIRTYFELEDKLELTTNSQEDLLELKDQVIALKEVIKERNLDMDKHIRIRSKSKNKQEQLDKSFDEHVKEGFKAFLIGAVIFSISLYFLNRFDSKIVQLIGLIVGGLKMIQGFIILSMGLVARVWFNK